MRLLLLSLVAVVAIMLAAVESRAASGGSPDFCNAEADNVVVYVDRTTPYDEADKAALIDGVSRLFESLKGGERFSIRTVAESFAASESLLDACIPFCPSKGFLDDLFSSCTEGVVINERKHLREEVVGELRALLENFVELPNSEIVRTIAQTSTVELRAGRTNRLYLFTDLIENSVYLPGKQFFSDDNEDLLRRVAADGLVPDLRGVMVRVFGVGRAGTPERRALEQELLSKLLAFWEGYFAAAGTRVTIQQSLGALP
jgi:hypothetical protein